MDIYLLAPSSIHGSYLPAPSSIEIPSSAFLPSSLYVQCSAIPSDRTCTSVLPHFTPCTSSSVRASSPSSFPPSYFLAVLDTSSLIPAHTPPSSLHLFYLHLSRCFHCSFYRKHSPNYTDMRSSSSAFIHLCPRALTKSMQLHIVRHLMC